MILKKIFIVSFLILSGCVSQSTQQQPAAAPASTGQSCEGGSTPVVDKNWNPQGCNPAKKNKIKTGDVCDQFAKGTRTTDVNGVTYECR